MRDISHNIVKVRLDPKGKPYPSQETISGMHQILDSFLRAHPPQTEMRNDLSRVENIGREGYCGSCYGGVEPEGGCCQTCESVRKAYLDRGWAFSNPEAVEQCAKEGWVEKVNAQSKDGCQIAGRIRLKKVATSISFSFGRSFQLSSFHTQELVPYLKDGMTHDFGHFINWIRFESDDEYLPKRAEAAKRVKSRLGIDKNPLERYNAHFGLSPVGECLDGI